jgi:peptidoglycan/xylan/chitin deacetylase (PgdA/CDA1 family)
VALLVRQLIRRVIESATAAPLVRVDTEHPLVALTFDDGPHQADTPAVLDLLAEFGARATFFVLADAAQAYPELCERIRVDGHQLAWHGAVHRSATYDPVVSRWRQQWRQLSTSRAVSPRPRWYRPPYGHERRRCRLLALISRARLVGWTSAPNDWSVDSGEALTARLRAALRPGAIVLLHDTLRTAEHQDAFDRAPLHAALRAALADHREYRFVPLDELVAAGESIRRVRLERGRPLAAQIERPLS